VKYYGDCVKICENFSPNFGDKELAVASRQRTVSQFLLQQIFFGRKQHDCRPTPTLLFSVSMIEDKSEMPPF
jgi:hypothetical protein